MLDGHENIIIELRKAFVEVCKSVFGESLVSIITKGSSVKGGFIPGLSDVDLHVYLEEDVFSHSDFLKLEFGLSMQEKMDALIQKYDFGGGPIQVILINVSKPPDWSGPLPGAYIVLYGDGDPFPPPTVEGMLKQDLDGLKNPTYAYKLISSFLDKGNDQLPNYVRRLNAAVNPALYRVLSLLTRDPVKVWKMTKFEVLDVLERLADESAKEVARLGREFYDMARKKERLGKDLDFCRTAIRTGYKVVDLGREIGLRLDY